MICESRSPAFVVALGIRRRFIVLPFPEISGTCLHRRPSVAENCTSLGSKKALCVTGDVPGLRPRESGCLDILVLNHIGPTPFAIWNGDVEHVRELMQVNFLSFVNMASAALPMLEQSAGSMIVVASLLDDYSMEPYAANKFAVNRFFGTMQHELAMQGSNVSLTITTLEKIRGHTNMTAYPASDAALHLITHQKK
ncbi:unnamed protein product [Coregonus sp. 'balchen']|nr:unnamed protein product [Coregonus sp. 'balchen']